MSSYYRYRFEDYYQKVKCPLMMLAEKESGDEREKAAMKGLGELAEQGEIVEVGGWAHPYCWFLNPEDACKAILKFLGNTAHQKRRGQEWVEGLLQANPNRSRPGSARG
ncbi:MAG: hypothetical protein GQ526_09935 [Ardenticatenales bacterium]|nr:hypothetical protein [Ardenticatenales bacterium]